MYSFCYLATKLKLPCDLCQFWCGGGASSSSFTGISVPTSQSTRKQLLRSFREKVTETNWCIRCHLLALPVVISCRFIVVTAVMAVRGALTGFVLFPPSSGSFLSFFSRNIPVEMWSTNPQVIGRLSQVMEKENAIQTGGGKTIYETLSHSQEEWATPAAQQQQQQNSTNSLDTWESPGPRPCTRLSRKPKITSVFIFVMNI